MRVKTGSYTGNNTDNRAITGVGFQPTAVIIKGVQKAAVLRFSTMDAGDSVLATGGAFITDGVKSFDADGFTLGTATQVNADGVTFYYVALQAAGLADCAALSYPGTGVAHGITGAGFQPDLVLIVADNASGSQVFYRSSLHADAKSGGLVNGGLASGFITSLDADGFSVGAGAAVNTSGWTFHALCLKNATGRCSIIGYTGDGLDNHAITGVGFQPAAAIIKYRTSTQYAKERWAGQAKTENLDTTQDGGAVFAMAADGYTLTTDITVNANTIPYVAIAFAANDPQQAGRRALLGVGV